jgi:O-antigen ligase
MALFTLIATISLFQAGTIDPVLNEHGTIKYAHLNTLCNLTLYPFTIFYIAKSLQYNRRTTRLYLLVFSLIGLYLTATAIFEHFNIKPLVWPKYILDFTIGTHPGRARGPFVNAVAMGRMLAITFICTVVIATDRRRQQPIRFHLLAILTAVAAYFTYTRGPWLGFAMALLVMIVTRSDMSRFSILLVTLVILCLLTGLAGKFSIWDGTLFTKRQSTVEGRLVNWLTAIEIFRHNPILGVGFGRYNEEFFNYYTETESLDLRSFDGNHNTFLGILAELGLVGAGLYSLILTLAFRDILRIYSRIGRSMRFERSFTIAVLAILTVYTSTAIFSDVRWNPMENTVTFFFLGIASTILRSRPNELH